MKPPRDFSPIISPGTPVWFDESQFPDAVRDDLIRSLRRGYINHKFHYDSVKQSLKWLELHERHSPYRNDPSCRRTYDRAFDETAHFIRSRAVHVIGIGCGGGQKDIRLSQILTKAGKKVSYTPCDVSAAMVLAAWQQGRRTLGASVHPPHVFDLASVKDLRGLLQSVTPRGRTRLITLFGILPNFEPSSMLRKVAASLDARDHLLISANLLPGANTDDGLRRVAPQYDNKLTREWLFLALADLGIKRTDGRIAFESLKAGRSIFRIEGHFQFVQDCRVLLPGTSLRFKKSNRIRLFFSYRYTPESLVATLTRHGFRAEREWITPSHEEGIFLVTRK